MERTVARRRIANAFWGVVPRRPYDPEAPAIQNNMIRANGYWAQFMRRNGDTFYEFQYYIQ